MSIPPEENKQLPTSEGKTKIHQCKVCGKCFPSGPALGGHMSKHYREERRNRMESLPRNFDLNEFLPPDCKVGETSSNPQCYSGDLKENQKEPLDSQSSNIPEKVEPLLLDEQLSTNVQNRDQLPEDGQPSTNVQNGELLPQDEQSSTNVQNREPLPLDGQLSANVRNREPIPRNFDLNELPPECEEDTSSIAQQVEEQEEKETDKEEAEEEKNEEEISVSDNSSCKKSRSS